MDREQGSDEFRAKLNIDMGTAVSPTSIDEKDDAADTGKRNTVMNDDQMIIVNPIARKKDDYDGFVLHNVPEDDIGEELTLEEQTAIKNIVRKERASVQTGDEEYREVYKNTERFLESMSGKYESIPGTITAFEDGDFSLELKKRYMLKAIDERWISMIEDHLTPLDTIIRKPSRFIEQNEEILPIELSKNITNRSIQHLSQHTNLISKVEGDMITPSKILNVFNDETMLTYENKFINTLVNRLYVFIAKRYQAAIKSGRDEKCTMLDFSGSFTNGRLKGKIKFGVEISEDPEENVQLKNYYFTTDLWHRLERLYKIVQGYTASDFVLSMGKAYIRPPVMRTNAILKNKNMRQCLELWEFIESYENIGYDMLIQENAEDVSDEYKKQLYSDAALQFLIFRYHIKNDFVDDELLSSASTDIPLSPKLISVIKPFDADEFNVFDSVYQKSVPVRDMLISQEPTADEREIERAIDTVLAACEYYEEQKQEEILKRLEESKRREIEEAKRKAEEEKRLEELRLNEQKVREAEEEAKRREEEAKAEAERAEEIAKKLNEEAAREAEIRAAEEARRKLNRSIPRKKKKQIRRAAEIKAKKEGVKLSPVFDYEEYVRYIER